MKTVIYLIVIILWGVLQARRKAMREKQKQEAALQRTAVPPQPRQQQAVALGPVSAEENRPVYRDRSIVEPSPPADYNARQSYASADASPQEVRQVLDSIKRKKKKTQAEDEVVEEIVQPSSSIGMQNYEKVDAVRRGIRFDKDSLRTFVVTREVLGPPRAKNPHRPGNRLR